MNLDPGTILAGAGALIGSLATWWVGSKQNDRLADQLRVERRKEEEADDAKAAVRFDKSLAEYLNRLEARMQLLDDRLKHAEAALDEERLLRRKVEEDLARANVRIRQLEQERESLMLRLNRGAGQ
jgi:phage shock protein A